MHFSFANHFFKNSPGRRVSQGWLLVSFRRSYIRFILILSIKGDRSSAGSGPRTLWHRNERTVGGGRVLEPAAVIKHLWQREQGTVVTKCLNYRKLEHAGFLSASPQHCHHILKTESMKFAQWSIHQDGLVGLPRSLPSSFHCLTRGPRLCHRKATISNKRSNKSKDTGNLSRKIPGFLPVIKLWCFPDGSSGE